MFRHSSLLRPKRLLPMALLALLIGLTTGLLATWQPAGAQSDTIHPTFPLLDANGENVLDSGAPLSTMTTCGTCHDTAFIAEHSFHTDVGLSQFDAPGAGENSRAWDSSPGLFGKWNPLSYGYLSPADDELIDLTTAAWIQSLGARHVGGGPATTSRDGTPLTELAVDPAALTVETAVLDPITGELMPWDWNTSGVVEMNCFLCHLPNPADDARREALKEGNFGWANTATLLNTGIVTKTVSGWEWSAAAFTDDGELAKAYVTVQNPANDNCGLCHGLVHDTIDEPLVIDGCRDENWNTLTTGQVFSPQRLSNSGVNLADKEDLSRAWDIHAERVVNCTDCHFSLNNPITYQESAESRPDHLIFDARRMDIGDYLQQPLHQFAKGQSAQSTVAPELSGSMRRCESCHSIEVTHEWLPYKDRHMEAISCESCHVPMLYAPAKQQVDWTVVKTDGEPRTECRGTAVDEQAAIHGISTLIQGFAPTLLPRTRVDGDPNLAPHNLIASWFWIYGDPARPVRQQDLEQVYLGENGYHAEVVALMDTNGDGLLEETELALDTEAKVAFIAQRLIDLGLENPRISGEIQPYTVSHNVTHGDWATKECESCHAEESRITAPFQVASYLPGGVLPSFVKDANTIIDGDLYTTDDGRLMYRAATIRDGLYVLGHDRLPWVDWLGAGAFLMTMMAVVAHGGLRFVASVRMPHAAPKLEKVYMYTVYERLWHWLQTTAILLLIFTGLIIHKPDVFGIFQFKYAVQVHNILAVVLVVNALLAAFYHIASGEIRQYLPKPAGFFNQAITQATFYLRGIFRGDEHPFEKNPHQKLNPLQQITYFGILNVLLPLQILTGILMWGVQRWPDLAASLGGLPLLAPFHTLIAWLFATFIVMHVYLTTTGPTPMAGIKAMMMGWDDVEVHEESHPDNLTSTSQSQTVIHKEASSS